VVCGIGILALSQVRRPRDLPLACLPLLLGAHQLIESLVWRGVDGTVSASTAHIALLAWAAIAFPLLPAFVPLAVLSAIWPQREIRRRILPLCAVGLVSSGFLAYGLITGPVSAVAEGHILTYGLEIPAGNLVIGGYLFSTLGAPLFSGNRDLREFGLVAALGAAVCVTAWQLAFASTWCAFAALISLMLVRWLWHERAEAEARPPGPDRQQSVEPLVRR